MVAGDSKPLMIDSPCVKICTLDARSGMCLGCGRTLDEISRWIGMSTAERTRIAGELPWRLAAPRAEPTRATE
jgi:predicted Fe-S protein YdhL (DUF1289 family)